MKHITSKYRKVTRKIMKATAFVSFVVLICFPATKLDSVKDYYYVVVNGETIGLAESKDQAIQAVNEARKNINKESEDLTYIDVDITYKKKARNSGNVQSVSALSEKVQDELTAIKDSDDKILAYTLKIDDYTVTLSSKEEVLEVLERAQEKYDVDNQFTVQLVQDDNDEVNKETTFIVSASKEAKDQDLVASADYVEEEQNEEADDGGAISQDGIKSIDFKENIEVLPTYVNKEVVSDVDFAVDDVTKDKADNVVYEVEEGDCLSTIANGHDMTTAELLAINPDYSIDSNIMIGDQIVVMVPKPELSVIVNEQKTYSEEYTKDVEYIDNPDVYVGNNTVIQEGSVGERTVTAMITYENGAETNRDIISEVISTEAVAKIVERGTKALPTYVKPLSGGTFTSGFGYRWGSTHLGVDWACSVGTSIRASRAGTVSSAGWNNSYGYSIVIDHGDGVSTRYAHLSKILVSVGDYVDQSDKIALSGNTGNSTGPHVHFEIIVNGTQVDPFDYLE